MQTSTKMSKTATKLDPVIAEPVNRGEGDHLIGAYIGKTDGPTLIVVGSLHGNEPGGAMALTNLSPKLSAMTGSLKGRVYFLSGNTRAIKKRVRFIDADLNRYWTSDNMSGRRAEENSIISEARELSELDNILDSILITAMDEVFVLDLHSTSSEGIPFATVGDTLRNRSFAQKFPVPILLGIEEQLDGTMLEYLSNAGAVTLGFEGGQHLSSQTVENHEALVWLALTNSNILNVAEIKDFENYHQLLARGKQDSRIFEVRYRHAITSNDDFEMKAGFDNFDPVKRGEVIGSDKKGSVTAGETGLLLMPLYQKLGEDGFFIGREIARTWLWLSGILRNIGFQKIVHFLPGVRRDPNDPATLIVNTRVASLFPLQIFHLLGFRRRRWSNNMLVVSRRRHDTDGPFKWKGIATDGR